MIRNAPLLLAVLLLACCHGPGLVAQNGNAIDLFDGQSLEGWVQRGGDATYSVENDTIVGTTAPNTPNSFLCTEADYADFLLELEFRVDPELNSGIQIRSQSLPAYRNGRVHGYQVEIDASDRGWTAGIYDESRRGWLNDLSKNDRARYAFKQNQWNHLRVRASGDRIQTWLNGVPAADLVDSETPSGFIALQVHGVGGRTDPLSVRWRNIRLTKLHESTDDSTATEPMDAVAPPNDLVAAGATIEKVAEGFRFTEGPAMGPDGKLYFSDIPNNRIHVFDPESRQTSVFREDSGGANGLMWTCNDALVACEGRNRRVTRIDAAADGSGPVVNVLASDIDGVPLNSPNDLAMDGAGGIYFTDPRYGNRDDMAMEIEGVYYLNRNRDISRIIGDLQRPNGLVLSLDNQTLYVADQADGKIWRYDVSQPGQPRDKQLFAEIGSDGMTIDHQGNIYCTWSGQVHVFSPQGEAIQQIRFPESPANVTFGGENNRMLYVTARTGLYQLSMNVSGGRAFANPD